MKEELQTSGLCIICGKETKQYCHSCSVNWDGDFEPTWYCDEHFESVVMTGNCCRGNEIAYEK